MRLEITIGGIKLIDIGKDEQSAPSTGSTAPSQIPRDVIVKILAARDALTNYQASPEGMREAISEAYHQLYAIACPGFDQFEPWAELEKQLNNQAGAPERKA